MSDLIKDLRELARLHSEEDLIPQSNTIHGQAADLIEQLQQRNTELEEIARAVAHIGVDFGFGNYQLEQKHIDKARELFKEKDDE